MTDFSVSVQDLKAKVEALRTLNSEFKARTNDLTTTEASLNGMWEGEAREAFHSAFQNDITQMGNFYNAIEVYAMRLNDMASRYEAAEAANLEIATERAY